MHPHNTTETQPHVGYRLDYAELFNWGTFTDRVYRIAPEGGTTLMTGANASGKTTFIEALLTLLVPEKRMRFYNRASGTTQRDERTEESYVLGEFGNTIDEQHTRQTERLRDQGTYSVLLAVFSNENEAVTLAQVRRFSGGELKRAYLMAHVPLTIAEDFDMATMGSDWRRALRQKYPSIGNRDTIDFFDGPARYADAFRRVFGMRSDKALTLFSQTVGLKVLGDLNDFVRQNMLEAYDMDGEFEQLKISVEKLIRAHTELEKTEEQIRLLEPIRIETDQLDTLRHQHDRFERLVQIRPAYVARQKVSLCSEAANAQRRQAELCADKRAQIETDLVALRKQAGTLDFAIRTDEIGEQLRKLKELADTATRDWNIRQQNADRYDGLARQAGLTKSVDATSFDKRITYLKQQRQTLEHEDEATNRARFAAEQQLKDDQKQHEVVAGDLRDARRQLNNIPVSQRRIREEIQAYLRDNGYPATDDDLPFVGELLEVEAGERAIWQPAIEKLLYSFALSLIVPDELGRLVNSYVKHHDLKGRLVFFRIKTQNRTSHRPARYQPDMVREKLRIKGIDAGESDYGDWLEQQLDQRFSYRCLTDLDEFAASQRAMTPEGFIKNDSRHEKDDSADSRRNRGYVLGWDNKALIQQYETRLSELDRAIRTSQAQLVTLTSSLNISKAKCNTIDQLLRYESFAEIDWQTKATEALDLQRRQQALSEANDRVRELEKQLADVNQAITQAEKQRSEIDQQLGGFTTKADAYEQQQQQAVTLLSHYDHVTDPAIWTEFDVYLAEEKVAVWTAETVDTDDRKLTERLQRQAKEVDSMYSAQQKKLEKMLRAFKEPADSVRQRFPDWLADTSELPEDVSQASAYVELLDRLQRQELGKLRRRFKQLINENMISGMTDFKERLQGNVTLYKDNIDALNQSLRQITYNPNPQTFIQLDYQDEWAVKIREFRQKLNGWMPNLTEYERTRDEQIMETAFRKIKTLIDELDADKNYRRDVTDVRNWLRFKAVEYYAEMPDKPLRVYETTGSLSGGEKAQLTYTILGSAIAYQFSIGDENTPDSRSFRFICIDESFSNQDDVKATYLLDLCQQLQLQLLVVTPNDKTHIVEPYISAVHLVQRRTGAGGRPADSVLYNLTIDDYRKRQAKAITAV